MGDSSMSAIALRPYLASDAKRCVAIFRASIEELASEDYDEDQREAWSARAPTTRRRSRKRLADALTLIATVDGGASASRA